MLLASEYADLRHSEIVNSLLNIYAKNPGFVSLIDLFYSIDLANNDDISWAIVITSFVKNGNLDAAMSLFEDMTITNIQPNIGTYAVLLQLCADCGAMSYGEKIYSHLRKHQPEFMENTRISNALINLYGNCEGLQSALDMFYGFRRRGTAYYIVMWNGLFDLCSKYGDSCQARKTFDEMLALKVNPNNAGNTLIGLCRQEYLEKAAMTLFKELEESGILPDEITIISLLNVLALTRSKRNAKTAYQRLRASPWISLNNPTLVNALLHMHGMCEGVESALKLLSDLARDGSVCRTNDVTWQTLASFCVDSNNITAARAMFKMMRVREIKLDRGVCLSFLSLCARTGSIEFGKEIHEYLKSTNDQYEQDEPLLSALVTFYGNAGRVEEAEDVYYSYLRPYKSRSKTLVISLINAYISNGHISHAMKHYQKLALPSSSALMLSVRRCSLFTSYSAGISD